MQGIGEKEVKAFAKAMARKKKFKVIGGNAVRTTATLKPATVNGALRVLRMLLNYASAVGIPRGHSTLTLPYRPVEPKDNAYRIGELARFFQTFADREAFLVRYVERGIEAEAATYYWERFVSLRPLFVCAAETGLRRQDTIGLRWTSVDLASGQITVKMRKTGKVATCPITPVLRDALNEVRSRTVVSKEWVFLDETTGKPFHVSTVLRWFEEANDLAGITGRTFHAFRHGVGFRLAHEGVQPYHIMKQLGHTQIATTMIYLRNAEHLVPVADALRVTSWVK